MIAWSLPAVLFLVFFVRRPQYIVTTLSACFFALLAFLFASLFYLAFEAAREYTVLQGLVYAIVIELVRWWFIVIFIRGARNFASVRTNAVGMPLVPFYSALAIGLGFGTTQALALYGEFIIDSYGRAAVFNSNDCTGRTTFIDAAIMSLFIILFNLVGSIVAMEGYSHKDPRVGVASYVFNTVFHALLLFSPTMAYGGNFCSGVFVLPPIFVGIPLVVAWIIAVQDTYSSRKTIKRVRDLTE
jgi:hypothetical protein